ncbi:MAG: M43 family zinc metalloprotease [Planctomycetota bacterium]
MSKPAFTLFACAAIAAVSFGQPLPQKCGTPDRLSQIEALGGLPQPPSDCSLFSTNPTSEYEPTFVYDLPVVFHVIQNSGGTGFIPMSEINEQMDVINEDFRALAGSAGAPGTDSMIQFHLATEDPAGNPTSGVTYSTNTTWFQDGGSYWNSLAWDPDRYINIYTNNAGGFLGYVPWLPQGGSPGSNSDRVVVLWSTVGKFAPYGPPYNQGRTLTHELGHYLGLEHTFSGGCGSASACYSSGDLICDTNRESSSTFGCPGSKTSCGSPDPIHNYMDYSDDTCMWEFTPEQSNRMRCTIQHYRSDLPGSALPGVASSPTPVSGASGVGVNQILVWTAGSGANSNDVYFGTDPTPDAGEFQGNQAGAVFLPGVLANNTTYYWRIDSVNGSGTTTGNTWNFTTTSSPTLPGKATNPSPASGAGGVSTTSNINWTAGSGATSHDVYFGTDSTPDAGEFQGNQTGTSFNPGALTGNTTYYWRIDSVNSTGTTGGDVWSFTTQSTGGGLTVTGISPGSIEALNVGTDQVMTISGTGFTPTATVEVDGVPLFGIPSPYTYVNSTTITFDPPVPSSLGSATVTVKDGGSEDSGTFNYVFNEPPQVQVGNGDDPVTVFSLSGMDVTCAGEPGDTFMILGSSSNVPSIFPGIVELEIGNNLTNLFILAMPVIPASGTVTINIPLNLPNPVFTFYVEGLSLDPVPAFPLDDTNMQEVFFLF